MADYDDYFGTDGMSPREADEYIDDDLSDDYYDDDDEEDDVKPPGHIGFNMDESKLPF